MKPRPTFGLAARDMQDHAARRRELRQLWISSLLAISVLLACVRGISFCVHMPKAPTPVSGTVNDYNPTSIEAHQIVRVDSTGPSGRVLLVQESPDATERDRFMTVPGVGEVEMLPDAATMIFRDCTRHRWRATLSGPFVSASGDSELVPSWPRDHVTIPLATDKTSMIRLTPRRGETFTVTGITADVDDAHCQEGRVIYIVNAGEVSP